MPEHRVLIVIPARSGSKGIPRKNLAPLCGKPLVVWTVEQAVAADIDRVILSTDDITMFWKSCRDTGVIFLPRPDELATDTASTESVLAHALEHFSADIAVILQPTSPLRLAKHIQSAVNLLGYYKADSSVSVVPTHKFIWGGDPDGFTPENHPKGHRPLRQTMHPRFAENGSIYVVRVETFLKEGTRFCGKTVPYIMPDWTGYEIDTPDDLDLVNLILADRLRCGFDGVRT